MKLKIKYDVSFSGRENTIDIEEDLGIDIFTWKEMSEQEKDDAICVYLSTMDEQPYWILQSFKELKQ